MSVSNDGYDFFEYNLLGSFFYVIFASTDIANMPVDNSDTDSDFESAVKATVEGKVTRSSSNMSSSKDPNPAR